MLNQNLQSNFREEISVSNVPSTGSNILPQISLHRKLESHVYGGPQNVKIEDGGVVDLRKLPAKSFMNRNTLRALDKDDKMA